MRNSAPAKSSRPARGRRRGLIPGSRRGFSLPAAFWTEFAKRHSRKSPLALERPFAKPLLTPEDAYRALAAASDRFRRNPLKGPIQFFIEDAMVHGEVHRYMPEAGDRSLEQYVARLAGILGGRRFGVRLEDYTTFDDPTWFRLRNFLRPYFDVIGIPAKPTNIVLFLGDYARTPFGIHQDFHETFVFVLAGRKRFRTWPAGYFDEDQNITGSLTYDAFLDDATTVEGGPGDVLYWPADHWHVGEGAAGFAVSLSMAVTPGSRFGSPLEFFQRAWSEAGERLGASGRKSGQALVLAPRALAASSRGISRAVEAARLSLEKAIAGSTLEDAVKSAWLDCATSLGIENPPRPLPWQTLKDGDLLCGDPLYPVVSLPARDGRMICSANGHSFTIAAHPGIRRMLGELNTGRARRVKDLIAKYSGTARAGRIEIEALPEGVRDILEKLRSIRAVTIVKE